MEFSDDSFAWSDASNDPAMVIEMDECCDSESNVKIQEKSSEKKRSKKRKRENSPEVDTIEYSSQKTIKSEIESDLDISRKKKKAKYSENEASDNTQLSPDPINYVKYRVKLEPIHEKNKKKKNDKSEIIDNDVNMSNHINNEPNLNHMEEVNAKEIVKDNAKKKRKKEIFLSKEFVNSDDDDDDFETKPKRKKHKKKKNDDQENPNGEVSQNEISCINSSTVNNHYIDDDPELMYNVEANHLSEQHLPEDQPVLKSKTDNKEHKLLDSLRFEDEDSADRNHDTHSTMGNLKQFCESNKNLSLINLRDQTNYLTEDDEIWVVKGPRDLNIHDFKDKSIKIDNKGKLKFNRQIYDTVIDNNIQKVPIMLFDQNKSYIKNVPINGVINIQNRIPKAHIPEENLVYNHQANFIPLPETKFRHPLFGVNYKKAIKIPSSVAERLNHSPITDNDRVKLKKHKKEKRKPEVESETEAKPLELESPVISSKKKKKKKSIKNDPESADAWESEITIEKNLFDF